MAPSVAQIHSLVAENAKAFKAAWRHAAKLVQNQLPQSVRPAQAELQPIFARSAPKHAIHRVALLKQSKGRWYSTHNRISAAVRRFTTYASQTSGVKYDRSALPSSQIGAAVKRHTGHAPFASTLRPNLTGGTLGRTAGGYAWGSGRAGGARYFSHGPAAPAQVINNVSQAVRAFFISGQKAQFDGIDPRTGEKRFRCVTALRDEADRTIAKAHRAAPGSTINFNVNPTITALSPLKAVKGFPSSTQQTDSLNQDGLLDMLSVDFARALKELACVLNDLQLLANLGDLPITYSASTLTVHFPGCNAELVESICNELGIKRGVVRQDPEFDTYVGSDLALQFPFAPSKSPSEYSFYEKSVTGRQQPIDWKHMMSPSVASSDDGLDLDYDDLGDFKGENPWLSSPSGYESLHDSDLEEVTHLHTPLEYQGVEGIYRFLEQCEPHAAR